LFFKPGVGLKATAYTADASLPEPAFWAWGAPARSHRTPLRNRLSIRATDTATENEKSGQFLLAASLFNPRKASIHADFKMVAGAGSNKLG
jgi:hypothetical protein